jgi:uncharacterized protein DUF1918
MMATTQDREWRVGDVIVVEAMHRGAEGRLGQERRVGEVLAVFGDPSLPHFQVRWDDGRETIYYPGHETAVHRPA